MPLDVVSVVDEWTLWHALFGILAGLRRLRLSTVLALAFLWEWFEATVNQSTLLGADLGDPNPTNSLLDVALTLLAWRLAQPKAVAA